MHTVIAGYRVRVLADDGTCLQLSYLGFFDRNVLITLMKRYNNGTESTEHALSALAPFCPNECM